jgi:hypothetical protein
MAANPEHALTANGLIAVAASASAADGVDEHPVVR